MAQGLVDVGGKACLDVMFPQFAQAGCGARRTLQDFSRAAQVPQRAVAIRSQVPERVVARLRGAARTELGQQLLQQGVDGREFDQPRFTALQPGQCEQDEHWLVRGVDARPLRAADVFEGVQHFYGGLHIGSA
ncbi:MAG: hypothetical protein IPP50_19485 [Piscinibacter sp.]|nr:hypothetical protein [Piscinibacter sp.]